MSRKLEYGTEPWLPPTKKEAVIDRNTKLALNILLVLLVVFNFYAAFRLSEEFTIVPDELTPEQWLANQEQDRAPWEDPYDGSYPVTNAEYEQIISERTAWMRNVNVFGIVGILIYVGSRLLDPWYRRRIMHRYRNQ